ERIPGLQTGVHESKHGMDHVMVQVEALSLPPAQLDLMRQMVSGYLIGAAQLDGFQHANRSLCDSILGGSLSGKVLFRIPAAGQIVNRPSCPLSRRQGF